MSERERACRRVREKVKDIETDAKNFMFGEKVFASCC